jgi:hypothetical protein
MRFRGAGRQAVDDPTADLNPGCRGHRGRTAIRGRLPKVDLAVMIAE